jgi:hypothetical protein
VDLPPPLIVRRLPESVTPEKEVKRSELKIAVFWSPACCMPKTPDFYQSGLPIYRVQNQDLALDETTNIGSLSEGSARFWKGPENLSPLEQFLGEAFCSFGIVLGDVGENLV